MRTDRDSWSPASGVGATATMAAAAHAVASRAPDAKIKDHVAESPVRAVGVDLRNDWPSALANAGFDPSRPTAWIAEGLLGYLPPDFQDHLLNAVTPQSSPGSQFATDSLPKFATMGPHDVQSMTETLAERWGPLGFDVDLSELVYLGNRHDVDPYLSHRGWDVAAVRTAELLAKCGVAPLVSGGEVPFSDIVYLSATRPETGARTR